MPLKDTSSSDFNARETELVLACFKCLSNKPSVSTRFFILYLRNALLIS